MTPRHPPVFLDPDTESETAVARRHANSGSPASTVRPGGVQPGVAPSEPVTGVPAWVVGIDQAAWVAGPDRRIRWMNRRAEALLGVRAADAVGKPCDTVVCARDGSGRPFCSGLCPIRARAIRREPVAAHDLVVGPHGQHSRWARFTSIPVDASGSAGGVSIVHLATDLDSERRASGWIERVASRSDPIRESDPRPTRALTPRESEILDLLVDDVELPRVAHLLGISKTTARNHVQRLTAALGAHSVQEAIAIRLLRRG
ncbi:MAG: helix-turn-helix transcriptional regulator [Planctomycetes bacterium]|nr:helix-turn-helix transcriptional regulator [Planctomycetota bacterium]